MIICLKEGISGCTTARLAADQRHGEGKETLGAKERGAKEFRRWDIQVA